MVERRWKKYGTQKSYEAGEAAAFTGILAAVTRFWFERSVMGQSSCPNVLAA